MGGGKSHVLVGLYHMANFPAEFLQTDLGKAVLAEAEHRSNSTVDLTGIWVVTLSADNMSPGKASLEFGPATTLHERFLWSLNRGEESKYKDFLREGPNKAVLARALESAGVPVLILLDELMDYALALSDGKNLGG